MANFADLETRVNGAAGKHLSDKVAVFTGGSIDVVFSSADQGLPIPAGMPRVARERTIAANESLFDSVSAAKGSTVTLDAVDYELVSKDTDPSGWTTWTVRRK